MARSTVEQQQEERAVLAAQFETTEQARAWRTNHGGWLFEGKDRTGCALVAWFHPSISPSDIFHHPLTKGADGRLF